MNIFAMLDKVEGLRSKTCGWKPGVVVGIQSKKLKNKKSVLLYKVVYDDKITHTTLLRECRIRKLADLS